MLYIMGQSNIAEHLPQAFVRGPACHAVLWAILQMLDDLIIDNSVGSKFDFNAHIKRPCYT